jgi:hypothetical protein
MEDGRSRIDETIELKKLLIKYKKLENQIDINFPRNTIIFQSLITMSRPSVN